MDKRPYTPPTIVRIKLEQQQAVLAACSTSATTLTNNTNLNCAPSSGSNCRKNTRGGAARDSGSTS